MNNKQRVEKLANLMKDINQILWSFGSLVSFDTSIESSFFQFFRI